MRVGRRLQYSILWVAVAIPIALVAPYSDVYKFYGIFKHEAFIDGIAIEKRPADHQSIRYRYVVNGVVYAYSLGASKSEFDSVHIGDSMRIIYDSQNPAAAISGDPLKTLVGEFLTLAFIVLGSPSLFCAYVFFRQRYQGATVS